MNKFIFTFKEYDSSPNPPYTVCYFAVREDGSLYRNTDWELFKADTRIGYLDHTDYALAEYLADPNEDVYIFKNDPEKPFIFVWTQAQKDQFNNDNDSHLLKWVDALESIRFLNKDEYKYYKIEKDPEEIFWEQQSAWFERDRDGDEGYNYRDDDY